jgi:hypothetical protein
VACYRVNFTFKLARPAFGTNAVSYKMVIAASFPRGKAFRASSNTTYLRKMLRLRVNGSLTPPHIHLHDMVRN